MLTNYALAANPIKNYYGYVVQNCRLKQFMPLINNAVEQDTSIKKLKNIPNTYFLSYSNEHYYLRIYPANTNTNIYIVSDVDYDKNKNAVTQFLNSLNLYLDRLDLLDTVGTFPATVVATGGLSILCGVHNWVRIAKVTKESARFTKALPVNYSIPANSNIRILVLKFKNNPEPLNFFITKNGANYEFSF